MDSLLYLTLIMRVCNVHYVTRASQVSPSGRRVELGSYLYSVEARHLVQLMSVYNTVDFSSMRVRVSDAF